jgi:hypothetical protein
MAPDIHASMRSSALAGSEVEDQIAQSQRAAWPEKRRDPSERDRLPEVRELVQRIAREHNVRRIGVVDVREEPALHDGHVVEPEAVDAGAERRRHRFRDAHGDDLTTQRRMATAKVPVPAPRSTTTESRPRPWRRSASMSSAGSNRALRS